MPIGGLTFQSYNSTDLPRDKWRGLSSHSLLNSPEWLDLWEVTGATARYFIFDSAESESFGLSCLRYGSAFWSRAQSQIDGLPGGVVFAGPETGKRLVDNHWRDQALEALRSVGAVRATLVDYHGLLNSDKLPGPWTCEQAQTQRLQLSGEFPELDNGARRHLSAGQKRGAVALQIASTAEVDDCHRIMTAVFNGFGKRPRYSPRFFEELYQLSVRDKRVNWLVCKLEETIIGFHVSLAEGSELISWLPYIDRGYQEYRPAYLLMEASIKFALDQNLSAINLGGSPPEAEGLRRFKERFGAKPYQYQIYSASSPIGNFLGGARRK